MSWEHPNTTELGTASVLEHTGTRRAGGASAGVVVGGSLTSQPAENGWSRAGVEVSPHQRENPARSQGLAQARGELAASPCRHQLQIGPRAGSALPPASRKVLGKRRASCVRNAVRDPPPCLSNAREKGLELGYRVRHPHGERQARTRQSLAHPRTQRDWGGVGGVSGSQRPQSAHVVPRIPQPSTLDDYLSLDEPIRKLPLQPAGHRHKPKLKRCSPRGTGVGGCQRQALPDLRSRCRLLSCVMLSHRRVEERCSRFALLPRSTKRGGSSRGRSPGVPI